MDTRKILAWFLVLAIIIMPGCKKEVKEPEKTEQSAKCYKPYTQRGNDCCLDKNDNGQCDDVESGAKTPEEAKEEASISKNDIIGQMYDRTGRKFDIYPSDQYDYSTADSMFKGYNQSIKLDGHQCHIKTLRLHKALNELQPYWRPFPIPCETEKDCDIFIKKNDPDLRRAYIDESDLHCGNNFLYVG